MDDNKKKTLVLSIVGVIVLVIAVVGVSFAMYSFTGTGTQNNVITTGTVSLSFGTVTGTGTTTNNYFSLTNEYPKTDAKGIADATAKADFSVVGTWASTGLTINYELGITDITKSDGATLDSQYIKIVLYGANGTPIVGTDSTGKKISELASVAGPKGLVKNYYLTGGTLTDSSKVDNYKIIAWVSDDYVLHVDEDNTDEENGGNAVTTTPETTHKKSTKADTYSFKLTLVAAQQTA